MKAGDEEVGRNRKGLVAANEAYPQSRHKRAAMRTLRSGIYHAVLKARGSTPIPRAQPPKLAHMIRLLLLPFLLAVLAPPASAQSCTSAPPLRGLPSKAEPFALVSQGHEAGETRWYTFGDVFLRTPEHAFMLWGENDCGMWIRAVELKNGRFGVGQYEALPRTASGSYVIRGAGGGSEPFITIEPYDSFFKGYPTKIHIDIPAAPEVDEGSEAAGVYEEWMNRQR